MSNPEEAPKIVEKKPYQKFKDKHTFEERLAEAQKKKEANPKLIPIIVEKHARSKLE